MSKPVRKRLNINPPVFYASLLFTALFIAYGAGFPEHAEGVFLSTQNWIARTFGWFYLLAVAVFLIFTIIIGLSSYGRIRLGPDKSSPEFSYSAWFAMLFSAGMGIGLMFFGVAEPLMHFLDPPVGDPGTANAAREAMKITFFHWGLHAWAIYAVVAMALAFFAFRHGLPLTLRSAFYPLLGERIYGPIGHAVDILAVIGTLFGIATSLGLGVLQINSGLSHLFDVPISPFVQVVLIIVVTAIATISVAAGLDAGIRRLSQFNIGAAILLLIFALVAGSTLHLLQQMVQNTGAYLSDLVYRTFNLYAYQTGETLEGWIGGWTLFYWAWWIAWSPFVGMFIARISRGRTIREFVAGVLLVPSGFALIWFTVFGNTAIAMVALDGIAELGRIVQEDTPLAVFVFLEQFPWAGVTTLLATVLVVTFFVTSSDSGALVIDILTSGGRQRSPVWQRVFWSVACGAVAAVLLLAGGLEALQAAAIAGALPLSFVLLFTCWGLLKALRIDAVRHVGLQAYMSGASGHLPNTPWQKRLKQMLSFPDRVQADRFLQQVGLPALQDVAEELQRRGIEGASVDGARDWAHLTLPHGEDLGFLYEIRLRCYNAPGFAFPEFTPEPITDESAGEDTDTDETYYRAEVFLNEESQHYDVYGLTRDQVIADVLSQYERYLRMLHQSHAFPQH